VAAKQSLGARSFAARSFGARSLAGLGGGGVVVTPTVPHLFRATETAGVRRATETAGIRRA
jgi:hypothetical protein